ncbi:hypothetical protein FEZ51_01990 [Pediococcus stilesii]|uniref:Uncharacterized protein n=1 Tax=Pediococcus stilesii TaxID=331679 RepID=A0A5R9BXJ4_9LACO|nr:hypothetical protein [Pediococcus stilesii]TLQ05454.1 hypothetical protein FEZ51_01990 [Pediococcus stilesii]
MATRWCDYVVGYPESLMFDVNGWGTPPVMPDPMTCDVAMCERCAVNHGITDFCPYHEKIYKNEQANFPDELEKSRFETGVGILTRYFDDEE